MVPLYCTEIRLRFRYVAPVRGSFDRCQFPLLKLNLGQGVHSLVGIEGGVI